MIEKITKLLKSTVWEDVLLGVELMVNNLNSDEIDRVVNGNTRLNTDSPYKALDSLYFISGDIIFRIFDNLFIRSIYSPGGQFPTWTKL